GYLDQFRNIGETENKGIELAISYAALERENYGVNISANVAFNRAKIVSIGGMEYINGTSGWASTAIGPDFIVTPGMPLGLMHGYVNAGRYEVSDFEGYANGWVLKSGVPDGSGVVRTPAPGVMKLADINSDGIIDVNDRVVIGNVNPKHTGGVVINGYAYG